MTTTDNRTKRTTAANILSSIGLLAIMEIWTAIIFVVGAVFMFLPGKDWIAFTLAGGVLTLYTSIMIPRQKVTKD